MMSQTVSGVEVRSPSGAWTTGATIVDYENNKITVKFDSDRPNEAFAVENVRFASKVTQDNEVTFQNGDVCELYRETDNGWFKGTVVNTKGCFYVCEFYLNGQPTKDVVDGADLRQANPNSSLSADSFTRATVELPEDIHEFCSKNGGSIHTDFQKACEAFSCQYNQGHLILLAEKDITKRVQMLREFHIKNLQQKMRLAERMVGLNQTLAENKLIAEANVEKFTVDADMVRFVVGQKGVNIKRARKVEGVMKIDIENNTILIYAKTPEAAKEARHILEFEEEYYLVPRRLVSRIVGQKGKSIQEIIEKSGILKIKILTADEASAAKVEGADAPDKTVFKFVGTKNSCENAIALMDYIIKSQEDIDQLLGETGKIEGEIKTYRAGSVTSSGYNSEPVSPKANSNQSKPKTNNQKNARTGQNGEKKGRPQTARKNDKQQTRQSTSGQPNKQVTVPAMTLDDFIEVKSRKSKKQQQQQAAA